jgi:DNA-directed RNA polymerase specialized sigma24 family protein
MGQAGRPATEEQGALKKRSPRFAAWGGKDIRVMSQSHDTPPRAVTASAEEETWNEIKHDLVRLKKDPVAREIEQKYKNRKTQIYLKGQTRATEWTVPLGMARLFIEQTKEWIESLNQIHGQVWEKQGKVKTPSFVRAVFQKALLPAIETGIADVKEALSHSSLRNHSDDLTSLQVEDIIQEVSQLRHEWQTRIEIEARELQLEQERLEAQQPDPKAASDAPREPDAANMAAGEPVQEKEIAPVREGGKKYPKGFDGLQRKEADMSMYYALVDLTQKQRECFSLKEEYGLTLAEVAGRLGIDRKTAYEHIHHANNKIKLHLEKRRDQSGRIKKATTID